VIKGNIFDCCATYVKEDYFDLNTLISNKNTEEKSDLTTTEKGYWKSVEECPEDITGISKFDKINRLIKFLTPERADNYDTWIKMSWCLHNLGEKEGLTKRNIMDLIHNFSKLSKNYDEGKVDDWITKNYKKIREHSYSWNYLYNTCIKEDNQAFYAALSQSYRFVKKEFEKNHFMISYPPMIVSKTSRGYEYQTIKNFKEGHKYLKYHKKTVKFGKEIDDYNAPFVITWLEDTKIRRYDYLAFKPPPMMVKDNEFNTWEDFKIKNQPLEQTDRDFWEEYKNYMYNLIGNVEVVDFILARYAFRFQNPGKRTNVCLVMCGEEGDGKNKMLEPIYKLMDNYTEMLDSAKKLYDTHSMYEKEKLFVLINEAGGVANFENADVLKTRITEDTLTINPKGIQSYKIDNLCDYDMTTNNFNVIKLSDDSFRRFLQVETTSYYRGNTKFFNDYITNIVENPVALRQIYEGFIKIDIKTIVPSGNFQTDKPTTAIEIEVKKQNRDKLLWFLEDFTNEKMNDFKCTNKKLFEEWNDWCTTNKIRVEYNNIQFGIKFSQIIKKKLNINGIKCITRDLPHSTNIFNIDALYKYFKKLNSTEFIQDE
jgi:hypothetical protein